MMVRVLVGALAAGVVVFVWGAISHMMLPIGEMGIRSIPNEDAVLRAMQGSISESGLYFFPGRDHSKTLSQSEQEAWAAKVKQGPAGILVVQMSGAEAMSPRQLLTEFAIGVVAAFLAGLVLLQVKGNFATRVLVVLLMGAFGLASIVASYWNWYGFPTDFVKGAAIDELAGWLFGGLVLAAIVRPASPPKTTGAEAA
jgi:hypothetical protein